MKSPGKTCRAPSHADHRRLRETTVPGFLRWCYLFLPPLVLLATVFLTYFVMDLL